jgi:glutathione peroxidase
MKILFLFLFYSLSLFSKTLYDFSVKDIKGNSIPLSNYKGQKLLLVNVASKCGYTYQYEDLEKLYQKYKSEKFQILAFPSNDFGAQEPGSNAEIETFCKLNYKVSFPLFSKIFVTGKTKDPLFKFLTEVSGSNGEIKWNFEKFLIDSEGKLVERFSSKVEPLSLELTKKIDALK